MRYAGPTLSDVRGPLIEVEMGNGEFCLQNANNALEFLRVDNDGNQSWSPNQAAEERFAISEGGTFYIASRLSGQKVYTFPRV